MITKQHVITNLLQGKSCEPVTSSITVFAPTNIALCKYWGKRNAELNLPVTSSLSIGLKEKGSQVTLSAAPHNNHDVIVNNERISTDSSFYQRLVTFLNLFPREDFLKLHITSNIPIAAGLASSASGFASLVKGLNAYYGWNLSQEALSILARLGSGSASRSLWDGFVLWNRGEALDGSDSFAIPLEDSWPDLRIGLVIVSSKQKSISSRDGMEKTVLTSPLYEAWPQKAACDLANLKQAIRVKDFTLLGKTAESNALTMHATMIASWDPVLYWQEETLKHMRKVWELRELGIPVYFTQDAGPNIKLIFLEKDESAVKEHFPGVDIVVPF